MGSTRLLIFAGLRVHRVRHALAVVAIAGATALLLSGMGARDAISARGGALADKLLGPFSLALVPADPLHPDLPEALVAAVESAPGLVAMHALRAYPVTLADERDVSYLPDLRTDVIAGDGLAAPFGLRDGRWLSSESGDEAVVSGALADRWQIGVGDILVIEGDGEWELSVVGVGDEVVVNEHLSGIFTHPATAARVAGNALGEARLLVALHPDGNLERLVARLREIAETSTPPALVLDRQAVAKAIGVGQIKPGIDRFAFAGAALGFLAASMIVGATFYADIEQRIVSLRMLRAVGASRRQIFADVLGEALVLGIVGALLGIGFGIAGLNGLLALRRDLFPTFMLPRGASVALALLAPMTIVFLAAMFPAVRAARLSPLEQPAASRRGGSRAPLASAMLAGAICLSILGIHFFAGGPGAAPLLLLLIVAALIVATPAALALVEKGVTRCLSRVGATADLLQRQTTGAWQRSSMMALLLAICLSLFVGIQIWGRSMLEPYLPERVLPARIVSVLPSGLPPVADEEIYLWEGIDDGRVIGMAACQTRLAPSAESEADSRKGDSWVLILAVDPRRAFAGERPILDAGLDEGDVDAIVERLENGGCLSTPAFLDRLGLSPGDELALRNPNAPRERIALPVVAAARLPGWQWISTFTKMRNVTAEAVAPVVVSRSTGERLFGLSTAAFYALDPADGIGKSDLYKYFETHAVRAGEGGRGAIDESPEGRPFIRIAEMDRIIEGVSEHAGSVIWMISVVPMLQLFFALLGVVGATMTGVRVRQYQFGVLRGLGATRGGIVGLIAGETTIIGLSAVLLSLVAGTSLAGVALPASLRKYGVGSGDDALIVPYGALAVGCLFALLVVVLAATLTARRVVGTDVSTQLTRPT